MGALVICGDVRITFWVVGFSAVEFDHSGYIGV